MTQRSREHTPPTIEATALNKWFGGQHVVRDVSLRVQPGTILGLIGPNGSGKTTTLNLLNGVLRPDKGSIVVGGRDIAGRPSREFVGRGITRTFQTTHVFSTVTAFENMLIPTLHLREPPKALRKRAEELLDSVALGVYRDTPASELSGGQQKLLEFVRSLMTEPTTVLMDEPFAGVHPELKEVMSQRILETNRDGVSFVVVSHEIPDLMRLSDEVLCLADGSVISHGEPATISNDPRVIEAYLGTPAVAGKSA